MQLFAIGSLVKLTDPTGDDQIDAHLGTKLEVTEFRLMSAFPFDPIPNYTLINVHTWEVLTANEYELETYE